MYREKLPDGTTRLTGTAGGAQGATGPIGPQGIQGTRWGQTPVWAFGNQNNLPATMYDGQPPRVSDLLVSTNGLGQGEVYIITAVNGDGTVNVAYPVPGWSVKGVKGDTGSTGAKGDKGDTGAQGIQGIQGAQGVPGNIGPVGPKGSQGDPGATGPEGPMGVQGNLGPVGPKGDKGDTGATGPQGLQGPAGTVTNAWPVGSVYMSFVSTDPATLFGGTWTRIGQGRMLVGVNESDTDFDVAGDTGGEKAHALTVAEMPNHNHNMTHNHTIDIKTNSAAGPQTAAVAGSAGTVAAVSGSAVNQSPTTLTGTAGSGDAHNNMPPFLAVYMFRRTA